MKKERNNKQFNSSSHKQKERKYIRIRMYVSLNELELQRVNGVPIKSIFFYENIDIFIVIAKRWYGKTWFTSYELRGTSYKLKA